MNRVTFHSVQAAREFYRLRRAGLLPSTAARIVRLQHTYF